MSVHLDDQLFDESPGVVCVVLSHAIESAGWRLLHVSEGGERVVWEVLEGGHRTEVLEALITPYGEGAAVSVHTLGGHGTGEAPPASSGPHAGTPAPVIDLHPRGDRFDPRGPH